MFDYVTFRAANDGQVIDLVVEQSVMTVTVRAGTFYEAGHPYTIADDTQVVIPTPLVGTSWNGYLVQHRVTAEVLVLVDDSPDDDPSGYEFDQQQPYLLLLPLFHVYVVPGVATLDDVPIIVWRRLLDA